MDIAGFRYMRFRVRFEVLAGVFVWLGEFSGGNEERDLVFVGIDLLRTIAVIGELEVDICGGGGFEGAGSVGVGVIAGTGTGVEAGEGAPARDVDNTETRIERRFSICSFTGTDTG